MTTPTEEQLEGLIQSAETLRSIAAYARDLTDKIKLVQASNRNQVEVIEKLRRENETLARNVPPEPPAEPAEPGVMTCSTVKVIGQQWCRVNRVDDMPMETIGLRLVGGWICLCNVLQDPTTGDLTYHPVRTEDLPSLT